MYPGNASPSILTAAQEFAQASGLLAKGTKITKTAVTYDFGDVTSSPADYLGSEELNTVAVTYDFGDVATSPNYLDSEQLKPTAKNYPVCGSQDKADDEESPYFTLSTLPSNTADLPDSTSDYPGNMFDLTIGERAELIVYSGFYLQACTVSHIYIRIVFVAAECCSFQKKPFLLKFYTCYSIHTLLIPTNEHLTNCC